MKQSATTHRSHPLPKKPCELDGRALAIKMAKDQGIKPISSIRDLGGDFWPEDESVDDFIAAVRRWRSEGAGTRRSRRRS